MRGACRQFEESPRTDEMKEKKEENNFKTFFSITETLNELRGEWRGKQISDVQLISGDSAVGVEELMVMLGYKRSTIIPGLSQQNN